MDKKVLKEGTLLAFEELLELYNDSRDMKKFAKGLIESLSFLTRDEMEIVIDEFNNIRSMEDEEIPVSF